MAKANCSAYGLTPPAIVSISHNERVSQLPERTPFVIILLIAMLAPGSPWARGNSLEHRSWEPSQSISCPAADFTLSDQLGEPFHLASSRGRVVVLTFIYTHCENECPFVTLKLKRARALLGSDAGEAVFVAVTTDPRRDTRTVIERYSREAGMLDGWYFLTGSRTR